MNGSSVGCNRLGLGLGGE
ncbi:hypothetical protein A2U01_0119137, partial [Trifolium medium]|nr:hypothetical protein [Trifolium medium]